MKKFCFHCRKDLEETAEGGGGPNLFSEGLCENCAEKILYEDLGEPLIDFLDRQGAAVLVINSDTIVLTANQKACKLLHKNRSDFKEKNPGDVIECIYSKLKNGCGKEVHCKSCTIRNAIQETFETGKRLERIQAYPDIQVESGTRDMCIEITTEKSGEIVFLQIDDLRENN